MVKLVAITKPLVEEADLTPEEFITYVARVSNPSNQLSKDTRLVNYLIKHKHWSPFEHVFLTFEIVTTRGISAQILRHRSFTFQEKSARYSSDMHITIPELRMQAAKNRQGSDPEPVNPKEFVERMEAHLSKGMELYKEAIGMGIAKETIRGILPLSTETTLYMSGSLRSFIHYMQLRCEPETQKEHREIAEAIKAIIAQEFKVLTEALNEQ